MTNTTRTEMHTEILNLFDAYAVHGGAHVAAEVVALSVDFVRRPSAVYRIATLADGSRFLAVRYRRHATWTPVFACETLADLVAMGWALRAELAS